MHYAQKLYQAFTSYLHQIDDAILRDFMQAWPEYPEQLRKLDHRARGLTGSGDTPPVISQLPAMLAAADEAATHLIETTIEHADDITWGQTYSPEDFGQDFLNKYCFLELIGTRGPIPSEVLGSGFLVMGRDCHYPKHSHLAEELYIPLTYPAEWQRGDEPWVRRPVGVPLLHTAWVPHAMRTSDTPLLAIYLWRNGDLAQKSRIDFD